jgi:hypothetical protein
MTNNPKSAAGARTQLLARLGKVLRTATSDALGAPFPEDIVALLAKLECVERRRPGRQISSK